MIRIIFGSKGTGKTKQIIDRANLALDNTHGFVVFLADTNRYVREIKYAIRFINTKEVQIKGEESLVGFLKGLISGNYDIKEIFIDGAARMLELDIPQMGSFIERLDEIAKEFQTEFILTVSCDKESLPEFFNKYIEN